MTSLDSLTTTTTEKRQRRKVYKKCRCTAEERKSMPLPSEQASDDDDALQVTIFKNKRQFLLFFSLLFFALSHACIVSSPLSIFMYRRPMIKIFSRGKVK